MSDDEYFSENSDNESIKSTDEIGNIITKQKTHAYAGNYDNGAKEDEEEKENDAINDNDIEEEEGEDEDEDDDDDDEDEDQDDQDEDDQEGGGVDEDNLSSGEIDLKKIKTKHNVAKDEYASLDIFSNKGEVPDEMYETSSDADETDADADSDDEYLQNLEKNVKSNYFEETHPECMMHNYLEIAAMTNIIRDKYGNIEDPLHRTTPILTKYEKTRILGQRTKQIESGSIPFVKVPPNIIESCIIAEIELEAKKIPFIVRRPLPSGGSEYWKLKDLELISF